jgi:hypothetical protein
MISPPEGELPCVVQPKDEEASAWVLQALLFQVFKQPAGGSDRGVPGLTKLPSEVIDRRPLEPRVQATCATGVSRQVGGSG